MGPGTLPTAGSHFYLNLYWAKALSEQTDDAELAAKFKGMYDELLEKEEEIVTSLKNLKEKAPLDIGGYFRPDPVKAAAAMRPVAIYDSIQLFDTLCSGELDGVARQLSEGFSRSILLVP